MGRSLCSTLQLDHLYQVRILLTLPQPNRTVVKSDQDSADRILIREVDARDADHVVELEHGVHVLDVQAVVIVDDVGVHVLRMPLEHRSSSVGILRLHCVKTVAFADVADAGVVGIDATLPLSNVSEVKRAVVGSKGKVLLILAEHAAGEHFASFAIQGHPEDMLDRQALKEGDLNVPIAKTNESDLLLAQCTLLIASFLVLRVPNHKDNIAILFKI